jgi:hypothetical protein
MTDKPWRMRDLNIVGRAAKRRQSEDRLRADAWQKVREAELEAVVNKEYDALDVHGVPELLAELSRITAPLFERFDALIADAYPAEFSRPSIRIAVTPGGIPYDLRDKIRRDAAKHIQAKRAHMLANSAGYITETMTDANKRATDNAEVHEFLDKLAVPNRATPTLEPPGQAIGILRKLLPHPEEWGFAGYDGGTSPLLPAPDNKSDAPKAIAAPDTRPEVSPEPEADAGPQPRFRRRRPFPA